MIKNCEVISATTLIEQPVPAVALIVWSFYKSKGMEERIVLSLEKARALAKMAQVESVEDLVGRAFRLEFKDAELITILHIVSKAAIKI